MKVQSLVFILAGLLAATPAMAASSGVDLTQSTVGYVALLVFGLAYCLVMGEEYLQLRKSKPVLLAAGIIWLMIGVV